MYQRPALLVMIAALISFHRAVAIPFSNIRLTEYAVSIVRICLGLQRMVLEYLTDLPLLYEVSLLGVPK